MRLSTYTHDEVVSSIKHGGGATTRLRLTPQPSRFSYPCMVYSLTLAQVVTTDQLGIILLLSCRSQGETTLCETTVKNVVTECLVVEDGHI